MLPKLATDDSVEHGHNNQWNRVHGDESGVIKYQFYLLGISKHGPVTIAMYLAISFSGNRGYSHGAHQNRRTEPNGDCDGPDFVKDPGYLVWVHDSKESLKGY